MYFNWNEDTIRWYTNAEKYSEFYKKLAHEIGLLTHGYKTLCDLGCGPALIDFEMARFFESIDCVDINETALSSVNAKSKKLGLHNIHTLLADSNALTGKWDVVLMSFYGSRELARYFPLCKKLIAVVAADSDEELFPRRERNIHRNTVDNAVEYLDGKGLANTLTRRTYEFGQPFASREDAELFVKTYAPFTSTEEARAFLDQRLVLTEDQEFPFYIPRMKSVGIFELQGDLT